MSREEFKDDCRGCRPALVDAQTGKVLADDSPEMQAVNAAWQASTLEQREAYHRITCQNSREPADLRIVQPLIAGIECALKGLKKGD